MKNKIKILSLFLIVSISLISCDSDHIFEENKSFQNNTWSYNDAKEFSFTMSDSITPVKIYINLRTTIDYEYSNIYMYTHFSYPNGTADIDTLEFFLAQPNGKWLGECSGTIVENRALITQGYLMDPGTYSFKIEQAMFNDALNEVIDIGIRVEHLRME
jgi:gliding motility-associated lipoprotein GldH